MGRPSDVRRVHSRDVLEPIFTGWVDINHIGIITVKNVDYRCIIHNIGKSEAINYLKNSVLQNSGCM